MHLQYFKAKLSWRSMNHGDVFILDTGLKIYVWNGREAGRLERIRGYSEACRIREEDRGGRATIIIIGM